MIASNPVSRILRGVAIYARIDMIAGCVMAAALLVYLTLRSS